MFTSAKFHRANCSGSYADRETKKDRNGTVFTGTDSSDDVNNDASVICSESDWR